jgi:hypothetical protein
MRSFANVNGGIVEGWVQSDAYELDFQNMMKMDIANAAVNQKGEEDGGEDESVEEGQSSECDSDSMALHYNHILVHSVVVFMKLIENKFCHSQLLLKNMFILGNMFLSC